MSPEREAILDFVTETILAVGLGTQDMNGGTALGHRLRDLLDTLCRAERDAGRREVEARLPTIPQFRELRDTLDWAIREKRKQIEAMHDADWVRPPEFDVSERDEEFLADFTRQGIQELTDIRAVLSALEPRLAGGSAP